MQWSAPRYVKPFVKPNKKDAADAKATCEAMARPNMARVPIKNAERQAILSVHRARQGFVKARTAQANQIRGRLAEYGITIAQGIGHIAKDVPGIMADGEHDLPSSLRLLIQRLVDHTSRNWSGRWESSKPRFSVGIDEMRPVRNGQRSPGHRCA